MTEERSAGFVLVADEGGERRYLILRHRHGGHWGFPKGRVEEGETDLDAARRETEEETGIDSLEPVPRFHWVSRYRFLRDGQLVHKIVHYHLARTRTTVVRLSDEHTDARWLPPAAARRQLTHSENRDLLDAAERHLAAAQGGEDGDNDGVPRAT